MSSRPDKRRFPIALGSITFVGLVLRIIMLGSYLPTVDDYSVVLTAYNYMKYGQPMPVMPFHPVLRNVLTWEALQLFGGGVWGAKFWSVAFGALLVAAVGLFVRSAIRDDRAALIAAVLTAIDILLIDYSRQSIQEVHVAFFAVAGAWLTVEAMRGISGRRRWLLPAAGVVFGLGVASKAYALPVMLVSLGLIGWPAARKRAWDDVLLAASSLLIIPAAIYLATYGPWFGRGYDLIEWFSFQSATLQAMIMHTKPAVGFLANNKPALWFVVPFYAFADLAQTATGMQLAVGLGNPLVWLAVLPSTVYLLASRTRRSSAATLLIYFGAVYLPLALSPRPVWMLSAVAVIPFAIALLALVLAEMSRGKAKRAVAAYLVLVLVSSALLYPLAIGRALEVPYLKPIVDSLGMDDAGMMPSNP